MLKNIGIIAGNGNLPYEVAQNYYNKTNTKPIIAAIEHETDIAKICGFTNEIFSIGAAGSIINFFKEHNVEEIILIGGIKRPDLKSIKPDLVGAKLLTKILKKKILGDNNLLGIIAEFLKDQGFKLLSARDILTFNNYQNYFQTCLKPSLDQQKDIEIGIKILHSLSKHDIGQAIIIENGYVLGIEAAEGTDNLIKRCATLRKNDNGAMLVKIPKLSQDLRLDLPTIGPQTIDLLAKYKFSGVAISATNMLISEPEITCDRLKKNNLFVFLI